MLTIATDTYILLADARQYVLDFSIDGLPDADADAEALLKRAARQLDRRYGQRYLGIKKTWDQPMHWPRNVGPIGTYRAEGEYWMYTIDSDGNPRDFRSIPPELGQAQVELACLISNGTDPNAQPDPILALTIDGIGNRAIESRSDYKSAYQADPLYTVKLILRPLLSQDSGIMATRTY